MRPCFHVEIVTPKKVVLNGLWFGSKKPKKVIIFIHGLTASAFSMKRVVDALVDSQTAVVTFNNRGFEKITEIKRIKGKEKVWVQAGATHEVFTECADDIQGAINFVKKAGVKKIYLAGHSTGCQKAVYYASRNPFRTRRVLNGLILFGPLSDYAIAVEYDKGGKLAKSVAYARALVRAGRPHELMPEKLGMWFPCDAQRFLSLYSGNSAEEIFTYWDSSKNPRTLKSVRVPVLVMLAEKEEFSDMPAKEIAAWFEEHLYTGEVVIVPKVGHGFKGGEVRVVSAIRNWSQGF
ncbi:MAG: alpha/beta fold hydrolase [bacterium]|nr:alpha/beta fold hydrolase [bacterium]